jgi:hypothetical protein
VENLCHRCHAPVEAGKPFCAQCGAPQIRVTLPEPSPAESSAYHEVPPLPQRIVWRSVLPKAAVVAVISIFLLGALAQVSLLLTFLSMGALGFAVVFWYVKANKSPVTPGMGMRIGSVVGFMSWAVQGVITLAVFLSGKEVMLRSVRENLQRNPAMAAATPEAREVLERILSSPEAMLSFLLVALIFMFLVLVSLSALGGAIAAKATRAQ